RAGHRDADPGLEDPVALDDAPERVVNARAIERVLDYTDQLSRSIAGQAGVTVERDAVADARQDLGIAHPDCETRIGGAPQQPVELLDLAALTLPAHPDALAAVPAASAMEEVEAVGRAGRVARIECLDRRDRCPEYLVLARQVLARRVREVREQCEI